MNAPGSPSSALHTTYLPAPGALATVDHFNPVGYPAPPRPRSIRCVPPRPRPQPAASKSPRSSAPRSHHWRGTRRCSRIDATGVLQHHLQLAGEEWRRPHRMTTGAPPVCRQRTRPTLQSPLRTSGRVREHRPAVPVRDNPRHPTSTHCVVGRVPRSTTASVSASTTLSEPSERQPAASHTLALARTAPSGITPCRRGPCPCRRSRRSALDPDRLSQALQFLHDGGRAQLAVYLAIDDDDGSDAARGDAVRGEDRNLTVVCRLAGADAERFERRRRGDLWLRR